MKKKRPIILASGSPRRQYLMKEAGFEFTVEKSGIDESFPTDMPLDQIARYLAEKKAEFFRPKMRDEIIVAADTVVILGDSIMNKPADRKEAIEMLSRLSGQTHLVITGVSIVSKEREESFDDTTRVTFKSLTKEEIEYYVDAYKPYDKAGAYGAQDCLPDGVNPCDKIEMDFLNSIKRSDLVGKTFTRTQAGIGMVAIHKIEGSYFNVMGLPIHKVYQRLVNW